MKKIYSTVAFLCSITLSYSQNVGVSTSAPEAKLDIVSTNSGILIPRVALTATTAEAPVVGADVSEMIYNTATAGDVTPGFYYWNGSVWVRIKVGVEGEDHDWYEEGTTTAPNSITDNIYTSGNVGIGAPSPSQKLHVVGNARISGLASGANGAIVKSNTSGDISITNFSNNANHVLNGQGNFVDASTLTVDHDWYEVGGTTAPNSINDNIYTHGKVGIGDASPMTILEIGASDGQSLILSRQDGTITSGEELGGIGFDGSDGNTPDTIRQASAAIISYATESHGTGDKGGNLTFWTSPNDKDDDTDATERMRIDQNGYVGIGTSAPTAELTVNGWIGRTDHDNGGLVGSYNNVGNNSTETNPIYIIGSSYKPDSAALNNMYGIGYSHTNASFLTLSGGASWGMYVAADGDARIWLGASSSANSYFNTTGNLGIGTDAPTEKMHIKSNADAALWLESDADNSTETDNAYIKLTQDGATINSIIGLTGAANVDGEGSAYTNALNNSLLIGTNTASSLQLGTNANARLTIVSGGKVGIGTSAPSEELEVVGQIDITGGGAALECAGAEAIWYNGNYFSWGYGGSANYFINPIGIGTTTPGRLLHTVVNVSGNWSTIQMDNQSGYTGIRPSNDQDDLVGFSNARWYAMYALDYLGSSHTSLKSDVTYLTNDDFNNRLEDLRSIKSITYKWNKDVENKAKGWTLETKEHQPGEKPDLSLEVPVRLGFAAETLPKELLDHTGENYSIPGLLGLLVASSKALDNKVTNIETNFGNSNAKKALTAGIAEIKGQEIWVEFDKDFKNEIGNRIPIVTITPVNSNATLYIGETSSFGFMVKGNSSEQLKFNWIAIGN